MEEQSSILIQKKIILGMTFLFLFASYIYAKYDFNISKNTELVVAQNSLEVSGEEVLAKQVAYTALTEVADDLVNPEIVYESEPELIINNTPSATTTIDSTDDSSTKPEDYKSVLSMNATAYCLCKKCCGKSATHPQYGVTASGYRITPGTNEKVIAVDTSVIPLGTKVYVEGLNGANSYGYAVAADTGSAIKNMKIDLYMDSHADALRWGFKKVNVYLLED
ncbi:MAG: 3D domain-containing protein [Clostridia bacterium]|nr:3D domain-containing protein [Clostridia bacterium]